MNLSYAPYRFRLPQRINASVTDNLERKGLLLRFVGRSSTGYSDLCPFPGWGDGSIEQILRGFKEINHCSLLEDLSCSPFESSQSPWHSLRLPEIGIKSLQNAMSPFDDLLRYSLGLHLSGLEANSEDTASSPIQFLWNPDLSQSLSDQVKNVVAVCGSFGRPIALKVKMGIDLHTETRLLQDWVEATPSDLRLRLDFNLSLKKIDFLNWWRGVKTWLEARLDFIEDPFEFDFFEWKNTQSQFGLKLAYDLGSRNGKQEKFLPAWINNLDTEAKAHESEICDAFSILILKPARQRISSALESAALNKMRFVLTHYMDHPLGQLMGFAESLKFRSLAPTRVLGLGFWPYVPRLDFATPQFSEITNLLSELSKKVICGPLSSQKEFPDQWVSALAQNMDEIEWQSF